MTARWPIVHLGRDDFDATVEALCDAFFDYPVMRYILKDAGADYDRSLTELVAYFTDSRVSRGWPVLGVVRDDRIRAVACINPPRSAPEPPELVTRYRRLGDRLGGASMARFRAFAASGDPFVPAEPHYYLGMLGVRREDQGHGHARGLLDALHAMSASDPGSSGTLLTTETPQNLPLYERFGYRIRGEVQVDELRSWTLFRDDAAR